MADAIRIQGLADLRKDLRAIGAKAAGRDLTKVLKSAAEEVAKTARIYAPRGPGPHSGTLSGSYRAGAFGRKAYVISRLPYASVQEFGGIIRPRGTPFMITARTPVMRALHDKEEAVVDRLGDEIESFAVKQGWY